MVDGRYNGVPCERGVVEGFIAVKGRVVGVVGRGMRDEGGRM